MAKLTRTTRGKESRLTLDYANPQEADPRTADVCKRALDLGYKSLGLDNTGNPYFYDGTNVFIASVRGNILVQVSKPKLAESQVL